VKALRRAWKLLYGAVWRFNRNDGAAMAGYIAFTGLLSVFPFLIFATTLTGILVGLQESDRVIEALFEIVPEHVARTLEPVVADVLDNQSSEVLTLSALFAIWSASNAVNAFRIAFDRAYVVDDPRGLIHNRALSVGMVFIGAVVAAILGFSILLSPLLLRLLEQYSLIPVPAIAGYVSYAFGIMVFVGFLLLMHRVLPGQRLRMRRLWPGVLMTTALWVIAATGFSYYLSYTPTYTVTYGTLAGVIITLMFFYLTGATIIFGAEFNATLIHARVSGGAFERKVG